MIFDDFYIIRDRITTSQFFFNLNILGWGDWVLAILR